MTLSFRLGNIMYSWLLNAMMMTMMLIVFQTESIHAACDLLPAIPTWADLTNRLAQAQQPQASANITLCPFRIEGNLACPTASDGNRIFNVTHPSMRLSCEGTPDKCLIDCPETQFSIERGGAFAMQNITMQNNINTMIEVQSTASFTSISSQFLNGQQGAIQGQEYSNIFILQGSLISGNKRRDIVIPNRRGAGVATQGNLEIRDSVFVNNENESNSGGAVAAGANGKVIVTGSTFRANRAPYAPVIFTEAASAIQLTFSDNRACDNVAVLSPETSCQGIYFLSSFACVPFGKGCLDEDDNQNCGDIAGCILQVVSMILDSIINSLQNIFGRGIRT